MEAPEDGLDDEIVGGVKRLDGEIGKRIDRRPLFEQSTQRLFRVRRSSTAADWISCAPGQAECQSSASTRSRRHAFAIFSRVVAFMNAPPPVASTIGPLVSKRAITLRSPSRK